MNDDSSALSTALLEIELVSMLSHYINVVPDDICETIVSFLSALVKSPSPIPPQILDQFIELNSHAMSLWYASRPLPDGVFILS